MVSLSRVALFLQAATFAAFAVLSTTHESFFVQLFTGSADLKGWHQPLPKFLMDNFLRAYMYIGAFVSLLFAVGASDDRTAACASLAMGLSNLVEFGLSAVWMQRGASLGFRWPFPSAVHYLVLAVLGLLGFVISKAKRTHKDSVPLISKLLIILVLLISAGMYGGALLKPNEVFALFKYSPKLLEAHALALTSSVYGQAVASYVFLLLLILLDGSRLTYGAALGSLAYWFLSGLTLITRDTVPKGLYGNLPQDVLVIQVLLGALFTAGLFMAVGKSSTGGAAPVSTSKKNK